MKIYASFLSRVGHQSSTLEISFTRSSLPTAVFRHVQSDYSGRATALDLCPCGMAPGNAALAARPAESARPSLADLQEDNHYTQFARKTWLGQSTPASTRVKPDVLKKEIWDVLESESFPPRSLLILENLQALERCVTIAASSFVISTLT